MQNRNILISGAGIAGPALALRLHRQGFVPTIVERAPAFRDGGYMIDVWGTGYDLVKRFGLMAAVGARGYRFDRILFVDEKGRRVSGFGGAAFRRVLHDEFFSIPRGDLARAIYERVEADVETRYGTTIRVLKQDSAGVDVAFSDGTERRFDLVIGADGLRSGVREIVFGAERRFEAYLGYCAASFVCAGYPHRTEGTYVSHARPGRQISRYAMRDDRTAFLLIFAADGKPGMRGSDAHKALLHARFGDDDWETPEILSRLDAADDLYFDAVSQIRMPSWSQGRVALIGDAAYSPSLLAGAGAAFGMLGAYVLAGELAASGGDHKTAFTAYEKRLRPFMLRQQKMAVGFAGSFSPKTAFGLGLRNLVLNLMNIPSLGAWMTRRMLGEPYPLPDYA